jgi:D-alanyl-D-alanine carboxypeptidase
MKPLRTGHKFAFGLLCACFAQASANACTSDQIALRQRVDAVIDAQTGDILYQKNADTHFFPASMTKRMTLLLALRALQDGTLRRDQLISLPVTHYTNGRGSVEMFDPVPFGIDLISVWDAIRVMNTASSNRAPQALARAIAGTDENFAVLMNAEARRLGIDAHFENPAGYPTSAATEKTHYITARAYAAIVRVLYEEFPDDMEQLKIAHAELTGYAASGRAASGRAVPFSVKATNKFLRAGNYFSPAVMGGKTGTTCASGASMDAVWRVNGRLIIGVTAGHATGAGRYDALLPRIVRPDPEFLARLDDSRKKADGMQLAAVARRIFGGDDTRPSLVPDMRIRFAVQAANPGIQLKPLPSPVPLGPPPSSPPDRRDQPFTPPLLITRFDLSENYLRHVPM